MKIRILLPIVILCLSSLVSFGQSESKKLYLKDGSVIEGNILEDTDYYVKIISQYNDTLKIGYKLISRIGKPNKTKPPRREKIIKAKGIGIVGMGSYLIANDNSEDQMFTTQIAVIKRILNGRGNIGLAMAYDRITFTSNFNILESKYLSPALYGRYYLNMAKTRHFVDGKMGYSWALSSTDQNGFLHEYDGEINASLGLGVHIPSSINVSFLIRTGVQYLRSNGEFTFTRGNPNGTVYNRRFIHPYVGVAMEF